MMNYEMLLSSTFLLGYILITYSLYKLLQDLINEEPQILFKENESDDTNDTNDMIVENIKPFQEKKVVIPYEEKYLSRVRNMKNEYVFTDEELEIERKMFDKATQKKT